AGRTPQGSAARSGRWRNSPLSPRVEVGLGRQLLEEPTLRVRQTRRHHDPGLREQVSGLALRIGQAAAAQPDLPTAGGTPGDLDLDLAARGVDRDRRAERGFPGGEPQLNVEIAPVEAVPRVRRDPHDEIQVAVTRPVAAATALPGQPDPLAVRYPSRHRDFEGPAPAF